MGLDWSDWLTTDNSQFDTQHQELLKRLNILIDAVNQNKTNDIIKDIFDSVDQYFKLHFETEERRMSSYNYPNYYTHKKQHEIFTQQFIEFKDKLAGEDNNLTIVVEMQSFLEKIWYDHINKEDKVLSAFLKAK